MTDNNPFALGEKELDRRAGIIVPEGKSGERMLRRIELKALCRERGLNVPPDAGAEVYKSALRSLAHLEAARHFVAEHAE